MSKSKSYFFEKTQKMFPHYEMKLWGEANITKEAFPHTYEILRNLFKIQNKNHNKLASISAIMRHEILFHKGGFFRDINFNIMKPVFVQFLKYNIVIGAERTGRHRWSQGMSFYASAPRVGHLKRMTSFPNLNKMRIYSDSALSIAGHSDFRQAVNGYEEYDETVLVLPSEAIYPVRSLPEVVGDLCTIPENKYKEGAYEFKDEWCYFLSNCE